MEDLFLISWVNFYLDFTDSSRSMDDKWKISLLYWQKRSRLGLLINHNIFRVSNAFERQFEPQKIGLKLIMEKVSFFVENKTNLWKGWKSLQICLDNNQTINICCLGASHVCGRQEQQSNDVWYICRRFHPSLFTHYHKICIHFPVFVCLSKI